MYHCYIKFHILVYALKLSFSPITFFLILMCVWFIVDIAFTVTHKIITVSTRIEFMMKKLESNTNNISSSNKK